MKKAILIILFLCFSVAQARLVNKEEINSDGFVLLLSSTTSKQDALNNAKKVENEDIYIDYYKNKYMVKLVNIKSYDEAQSKLKIVQESFKDAILWKKINKVDKNLSVVVPESKQEVAAAKPAEKLEQVKIGFYINDISKLNIKDNSFQTDFYVWFLWEDDELKPYESFELMNGRVELQNLIETKKVNNMNYASKRIKATIRQNFDVTRFPLDSHKLIISFEDTVLETGKLVYVADNNNTKVDPTIIIPGYIFDKNRVNVGSKIYESNWGDASLGTNNQSSYSRATYEVEIYRDGIGIFFKTFLGFFISILIAFASFAIRPDYGARFSLTIGAIFAAVMNITMVKAYLPDSNSWTLADMIGIFTLFVVFVIIAVSSYSLKLYDERKLEKMAKVDKLSFTTLLVLYIVVVTFLSL